MEHFVQNWNVRKPLARSRKGIVATQNRIAGEAGVSILNAGGNAVDAIVTAGLVLSVVDSHNSGIGGGCFLLLRRANGEVIAIDGRETAPAKATRDMFLRDGDKLFCISTTAGR